VVRAELCLDLGDPAAAADGLESALRRVPAHNQTLRAAPLEVMVRAKAAGGDYEAAASHLSELRSIAEAVGTRPLHASARLCEGLVAAGRGDHETARAKLEDAVELFVTSGASFELARARLALAGVLLRLGRADAAAREARLALERLDEIGAEAEAARARELLGGLEVETLSGPRDDLLTARQLEVLRLISEGLTDGEIGSVRCSV
jgi:ATP/maltotriose-dependent transcriptional regulator MalT